MTLENTVFSLRTLNNDMLSIVLLAGNAVFKTASRKRSSGPLLIPEKVVWSQHDFFFVFLFWKGNDRGRPSHCWLFLWPELQSVISKCTVCNTSVFASHHSVEQLKTTTNIACLNLIEVLTSWPKNPIFLLTKQFVNELSSFKYGLLKLRVRLIFLF